MGKSWVSGGDMAVWKLERRSFCKTAGCWGIAVLVVLVFCAFYGFTGVRSIVVFMNSPETEPREPGFCITNVIVRMFVFGSGSANSSQPCTSPA